VTEDIILEGDGARRAAEILVRRGVAAMKHASPNCACGINEAGDKFVDPICRCGKMVYWWDGEYEGGCELVTDHEGPHYDGLSWYNDDNEEVSPPEEEKEHFRVAEEVPSDDVEDLLKDKVIIRFSIQYPAVDGTHEISQGTVTVTPKEIDLAILDVVGWKSENLLRQVLGRFYSRRWMSKHVRCNHKAPDWWPLVKGATCKLEEGHTGTHVLDWK